MLPRSSPLIPQELRFMSVHNRHLKCQIVVGPLAPTGYFAGRSM